MIKATFDAFKKSESPKSAASKRSKQIKDSCFICKCLVNMRINQIKSTLTSNKKRKRVGRGRRFWYW